MHPSGLDEMIAIMAAFGSHDRRPYQDASEPGARLQPFILICISQTTC